MRSALVALWALAAAGATACARPRSMNVMEMKFECDSIPPALAPGERSGGIVPSGATPVADSAVVVGTVVESGTGRVVFGARVRVLGARSGEARLQGGKDVYADRDGGFTLAPLAPGSYTIKANRIGYQGDTLAISVRAGTVDTVAVRMRFRVCGGY